MPLMRGDYSEMIKENKRRRSDPCPGLHTDHESTVCPPTPNNKLTWLIRMIRRQIRQHLSIAALHTEYTLPLLHY